jgi:hypothetical protein
MNLIKVKINLNHLVMFNFKSKLMSINFNNYQILNNLQK